MAKLENKVPKIAVAALNAAQRLALESGVTQVVVLDGGLYRIDASGAKELLRTLPPRAKVSRSRSKRAKV